MLALSRNDSGALQVREQDVKLQRATARLEALSFALFSAKTNLQTAGSASITPCPVHGPAGGWSFTADGEEVRAPDTTSLPHGPSSDGVSPAHRFYLQLKAGCARHECAVAPEAPCSVSKHGLDAAEEETLCTEPTTLDLLASLKVAVADAVAENLALSSMDRAGGFRCSFTTRRCGMCARVQVEDTSWPPDAARRGLADTASVAIRCDIFLSGACQHASTLHAAGLSAEQVVRQAFWPAMGQQ